METIDETAKRWVDALNSGDVDALIRVSESDITIAGPRGIVKGADVLRQWYAHTHLTFDLEGLIKHDDQVIAIGTAHWHSETGSELGKATTAFLMRVSAKRLVAELSRYDEGLGVALAASDAPNRLDWQVVTIL